MPFYRITTCDYIDDISGEGAYLFGGRWNSKNTRMLYTAEHSSLALLEALAHMTQIRRSRSYCLLILGASDTQMVHNHTLTLSPDTLPLNWRNSPGPDELRKLGDEFVAEGRYLALKVPSVVDPFSCNYLFNPAHPLFQQLAIIGRHPVSIDGRLL